MMNNKQNQEESLLETILAGTALLICGVLISLLIYIL